MALNCPLLSPAFQPNGSPITFPAPYQGEFICAGRDHCNFSIDGPSPFSYSGPGNVFLTNFRMVFVLKKPTQAINAIEIPLLFIQSSDVSQPIFGVNNLHGICKLTTGPGQMKWKLSFTNGGMGTLVPLFYSSLEYIRVTSARSSSQHTPTDTSDSTNNNKNSSVKPPSFLSTALTDPNDPTKIYLTQPIEISDQQPTTKYPIL